MARNLDRILIFAESRHDVVKEYIRLEDFLEICEGFNKFEDDRWSIPLDVCDILQVCKSIGFDEISTSGLQLILLTSIIELLNTKEYIKFPSWYKRNIEKFKEIDCHKAYGEWERKFSTSKNFRSFFFNLTKLEKINLLTKIHILYENENLFAPFCYRDKEKCFYGSVQCKGINNIYECNSSTTEEEIDKGIKRYANVLYGLRNNFVHKARIPTFSAPLPLSLRKEGVITRGRTMGWAILSTNEYTGKSIITLYTNDLYQLVLKYLLKMFRDYLV